MTPPTKLGYHRKGLLMVTGDAERLDAYINAEVATTDAIYEPVLAFTRMHGLVLAKDQPCESDGPLSLHRVFVKPAARLDVELVPPHRMPDELFTTPEELAQVQFLSEIWLTEKGENTISDTDLLDNVLAHGGPGRVWTVPEDAVIRPGTGPSIYEGLIVTSWMAN